MNSDKSSTPDNTKAANKVPDKADIITGSETQTGAGTKANTGIARYFWVTAIAAVIGYGAVYVTANGSDNHDVTSGVKYSKKPAAKKSAVRRNRKPAGPRLNRGEMAAFVYKKQRQPLPKVVFADINSAPKTLGHWHGKVVLLNLWATWCAPCRREMPDLDQLQAKLGSDKFEVVALSIDRKGVKAAKRFLDKIKVTHLAVYNDATTKLAGKLKIIGMPTTLLLDAKGREVGRLIGPAKWDGEDAIRLIKAQIALDFKG